MKSFVNKWLGSSELSQEPVIHRIDTGAYATGVLTCLMLEEEEKRLLQTGGRQ